MEIIEISKESNEYKQVIVLLQLFDIHSAERVEFVDSSHGEDDIRHNYLIDKKYVLRINSAKVMTEERLTELNTLIERYRSFGMKAPLFLKAQNGKFVVERDGMFCYLSEYLDYPLADDVKHRCREDLRRQRIIFVARFAEQFKNVDLIDTVSMYSIFDLAPYDKLSGLDIDEKQDVELITGTLKIMSAATQSEYFITDPNGDVLYCGDCETGNSSSCDNHMDLVVASETLERAVDGGFSDYITDEDFGMSKFVVATPVHSESGEVECIVFAVEDAITGLVPYVIGIAQAFSYSMLFALVLVFMAMFFIARGITKAVAEM
jgi:hypothetical protein